MNFCVIVTLGPSILNPEKLKTINSYGNCLYRINGAHVNIELVPDMISQVRDILPDAKLILDLPGNKIRTKNLSEPIRLINGETFELFHYQVNYGEFSKLIKQGDIISANDSLCKMKVVDICDARIKILSYSDGLLFNNKGLHAQGISDKLPFLFDSDIKLIGVACKHKIDYLSLSFVRDVSDIEAATKVISSHHAPDLKIISKIETAAALKNIKAILQEIDIINVDRGDLFSDIGMMKLPPAQNLIIEEALSAKKEIFLATQILRNMENHPIPLISEIVDLYKNIQKGISGVQLSEETAVGKYATECVKMIFDSYENFKVST
tara:strand:+ start:94 stop:1062 length:969 start_codon:yes stop_codon:yes gene_type:complete